MDISGALRCLIKQVEKAMKFWAIPLVIFTQSMLWTPYAVYGKPQRPYVTPVTHTSDVHGRSS